MTLDVFFPLSLSLPSHYRRKSQTVKIEIPSSPLSKPGLSKIFEIYSLKKLINKEGGGISFYSSSIFEDMPLGRMVVSS